MSKQNNDKLLKKATTGWGCSKHQTGNKKKMNINKNPVN